MYRSSAKRLSAFIVSVGFFLAGTSALFAAQAAGQVPKVKLSVKNGKSAPLRSYQMAGPVAPQPPREVKNKQLPAKGSRPGTTDPVVQRRFGLTTPGELGQFEGGSSQDNADVVGFQVAPPDTNGDIGLNHYVQYINLIVTMYDRDGNIALGPLPGNAFWQGLGGICEAQNDGDPIVLYDQLANRWFVSQFAFPAFPGPPYVQCVAVSVTDDPTGEYYQYEFQLPDTYLNDYPKFGVWPDGYYMTFNGFDVFGGGFQGGAIAFDRAAMLDGQPATMIEFNTGSEGGVLPSDMDGLIPPPAGSPNYFVTYQVAPERLLIWQFHADFATPANSTFTGPVEVPVAPFATPVCGNFRDQCVPQLDSPELLETLSQATMFRLAYRNFGDHESLVTNQTVNAGDGVAGIRWYEIRNPGGTGLGNGGGPVIHQEGTFSPDTNHRWMGSIAQDANGNMALGYSISSESMYPSIAITGRLEGDPLGTMGAENIFVEGGGSQSSTSGRWGDYSSMSVDPIDDCTFWYTQEYYQVSGSFDWNTRVGSFKYPGCLAPGQGTISGTVTDGTNPLQGVKVAASSSSGTTNAAGEYSITLPVGIYDMTASKYGYISAGATGVEVTEGGDTIQNFELAAAPSIEVNGTVKDGSGGGWPLFANIKITGSGAPTFNIQTDPVTGYYSIVLVQGLTYTFQITSVAPGYLPGGGTLPLPAVLNTPGGVVKNWELLVDAETCNAPGYTLNIDGLYETFEGGGLPKGWEITNETGNDTWYINLGPDPFCGDFGGNLTGGTGYYAVVNSDCAGFADLDTSLVTSSVDMSGLSAAQVRFNTDYRHYGPSGDVADVDISIDGGTSWTNVWQKTADARGPRVESVDITTLAAGEADVRARFHYYNAFFAWWWQVDNVLLGNATCDVNAGGLVVGRVTSLQTGQGLNGATVKNLPDDAETQTFNAPGKGDGFYVLFAPSGNQPFEASLPLYGSVQKSTLVVPNSTQRLDFALPSGLLTATPSPLNGRADPDGDTDELVLTMTNTGSAPASFVIGELDMAPPPAPLVRPQPDKARVSAATARIPKGQDKARSTQSLPQVALPSAPEAAGGTVLASYPTDITYGWGVATDTDASTLWISNLAAAGGDDLDYEYSAVDGALTGNTIDDTVWVEIFGADGAYNSRTGMVWRLNVGNTDFCLYELDPVNHVATGNKICPDFGTSERGLAYDPVTDTFWAGGWNDLAIIHFDSAGNILDGAFTGIPTSGLAYDPRTGNLYAMQNSPGGIDVWILEAATYNITGFFTIKENGSPVMTPFGGAGMDADCDGNLWVVDQNTQTIYKVASGTSNWCVNEIPWLSEDPTEGTVAAGSARAGGGSTLPVTVTFDSTGLNPGLRQAQLVFRTDTPNPLAPVPVNFTVRFLDVPDSNQFEAYIYGAAGAGIMTGCGADNFCPDGFVTRSDMAGYIERAMKGADYLGSPYQGGFSDVSQQTPNANYIQALVDDGITAGCGTGIYCPNNPVTRAQMSVFIVKATEGAAFVPPACTPPGTFADVPCPGGFAVDFIEYLVSTGVTAGCGGGNFCPNASISNGQMAVFLVKAFNVPHL